MGSMKTLNKRSHRTQLQRLSEKTPTWGKRQSDLGRNIKSLAEMTRPQRKKLIEKLHYKDKRSVREIAKLLGLSYSCIRWHIAVLGIPMRPRLEALQIARDQRMGGHSFNWKGGRKLWKNRYWYLYKPDHPNANSRGYLLEHRYVMSEKIGRALKDGEVVHHRDGDRSNNHPDNLQLMLSGGRYKYHGVPVYCPNCNFELKQDSLE